MEPTPCGEGGKTTIHAGRQHPPVPRFYSTDHLLQAMILTGFKRKKNHLHGEGKHAATLMQIYSNVQCNQLWEEKINLF